MTRANPAGEARRATIERRTWEDSNLGQRRAAPSWLSMEATPVEEHRCHVCAGPIKSGGGVPCSYCEGWFHLPFNTSTPGAVCGRRTLNYTTEGACGVLHVCAPCERRLAGQYGTAPSRAAPSE